MQKDRLAITVQKMRADKALKELDPDAFEAAFLKIEEIMGKAITAIPKAWEKKGIDIAKPGWLGELPSTTYDAVMEAITPDAPGKKEA